MSDEQTPTKPHLPRAAVEAFGRYCLALAALQDGPADVTVSAGGSCIDCKARVPAGIPKRYERTGYELCPACVVRKGCEAGLQQRLDTQAGDAGPELLRARLYPVAKPKAEHNAEPPAPLEPARVPVAPGLTTTINRLERDLVVAPTPEARARLERLLEAARAAANRGPA